MTDYASRWRSTAAAILLLLVCWAEVGAQDLPTLTAPINDFSNVIDPGTERHLDDLIRRLQAATGDTVVVVTVPTIGSAPSIEDYAVRLFERAGIGDRTKANGLLLLVATGDRKVRIEVGYGLEEFVTDGYAGETIRQEILPAFREGRYTEGIEGGTLRLLRRLADARQVTLDGLPPPRAAPVPESGLTIQHIALIIVLLIILASMARSNGPRSGARRRRGGTWSGWHGGVGGYGGGFGGFGGGFGGGGGGGFGGFGGGRSGGGGASGGW